MEEVDEDQPRKRKKKGSALPWILAGGGVALVAAAIVVVVLVMNKGPSSGNKDNPGANLDKTGDKKIDDKKSDDKKSDDKKQPQENGWTPAARYLEQLDSPRPLTKYQMQLPKGYKVEWEEKAAGQGGKKIQFESANHDPLTAGLFVQIDANLTPDVIGYYTKDKTYLVAQGIDGICKSFGYGNLKKGNIESGSLAGGTFFRIRLTATDRQNRRVTGFYYRGVCGNDLITLQCFAIEPAAEEAANLVEAAALTFRK